MPTCEARLVANAPVEPGVAATVDKVDRIDVAAAVACAVDGGAPGDAGAGGGVFVCGVAACARLVTWLAVVACCPAAGFCSSAAAIVDAVAFSATELETGDGVDAVVPVAKAGNAVFTAVVLVEAGKTDCGNALAGLPVASIAGVWVDVGTDGVLDGCCAIAAVRAASHGGGCAVSAVAGEDLFCAFGAGATAGKAGLFGEPGDCVPVFCAADGGLCSFVSADCSDATASCVGPVGAVSRSWASNALKMPPPDASATDTAWRARPSAACAPDPFAAIAAAALTLHPCLSAHSGSKGRTNRGKCELHVINAKERSVCNALCKARSAGPAGCAASGTEIPRAKRPNSGEVAAIPWHGACE